jgi:hypothetical protein
MASPVVTGRGNCCTRLLLVLLIVNVALRQFTDAKLR